MEKSFTVNTTNDVMLYNRCRRADEGTFIDITGNFSSSDEIDDLLTLSSQSANIL